MLPEVPVRQWACSLPWQQRYLLGYDRVLCERPEWLAAVVRDLGVEATSLREALDRYGRDVK